MYNLFQLKKNTMGKIYSYEFKFDHKHPDKIIVKNEIEK